MARLLGLFRSPYSAQLFSLGGSAALTFFSALFLIPEERGLVAVFLAVLSVGSYVACFGVQSEILQSTARGDGELACLIIRKHVIVQIAFAALVGVGLAHFNPFQGMSVVLSYWAAGGIFTGSLFNNMSWRQYGAGRFFLSTALRGVIPLATLLISFAIYLTGSVSAEAVASIYVVLQLLCLPFLAQRGAGGGGVRFVNMFHIYKSSVAFFLCQAESLVLARTPVIASGVWLQPQMTAVISISLSLAELQSSLPQMRSAISFKEASTSGRPRLTKMQLSSSLRALLPGTVAVILLSFLARMWLDPAYRDLPLFVGLMSLGVALQAIAASAINVMTARRSLNLVIGIQFALIVMAASSLILFAFGHVPSALFLWSIVVAAGCLVIIVLATRGGKGRHL